MNKLILGDSLEILKDFKDSSIDAIVTDPPYGYLKHKLDAHFDYEQLFPLLYQKLKKDSLLTFFGRGTPLFKWCVLCDELGFEFKEEIVWSKHNISNFLNSLPRNHELAIIYQKGKKKLNKVLIDKIENNLLTNPEVLVNDLKRITSAIKNIKSWEHFKSVFIDFDYVQERKKKHGLLVRTKLKNQNIASKTFISLTQGRKQRSIIKVKKDHYNYIHPTQKPLELIKRLIRLTTEEKDTVLDPFCGSATTAIACLELNRKYVCIEKEEEYFKIAQKRIADWHNKKKDNNPQHELPEEIERETVTESGQLKLF